MDNVFEQRQPAQDFFRSMLLTVLGQAYTAAGYGLEPRPVQWAGGLFRFARVLDSGVQVAIEYQHLVYTDSQYSAGMPSRFRVTLTRSEAAGTVRKTLSELVVTDFGVAILPSADHWWVYHTPQELGHALAEAGHLSVGYGMPWLAGDLQPPERDSESA